MRALRLDFEIAPRVEPRCGIPSEIPRRLDAFSPSFALLSWLQQAPSITGTVWDEYEGARDDMSRGLRKAMRPGEVRSADSRLWVWIRRVGMYTVLRRSGCEAYLGSDRGLAWSQFLL